MRGPCEWPNVERELERVGENTQTRLDEAESLDLRGWGTIKNVECVIQVEGEEFQNMRDGATLTASASRLWMDSRSSLRIKCLIQRQKTQNKFCLKDFCLYSFIGCALTPTFTPNSHAFFPRSAMRSTNRAEE